ncbi:uncharacterized protein E0L32_007623 [Thyridium curvatum]|uniref:Uncharacterized protein n=1 Tax=Thyridium curvatum TaxID=1093900 RepID=A0A507AYW8_9PEZI|nr:uncharacterized protein E0L32_007623 [Thyridium curvatum]TPX11644.1 hypothetical protein E0L32_007623 [Thyridium curvatum]
MGTPNPFISNGTCYFGPNQKASSQFLPCGNDLFGRQTCCQAGDVCLSNHACYNGRFGVTYLAGCSDPEYRDGVCPDKGAFSDQPWAGLVYCNGTSNQWVACKEKKKESTLTDADACWCPETSRTVAFTAPSVLDNTATVPTSAGGSMGFNAGYVPSMTLPGGGGGGGGGGSGQATSSQPTATRTSPSSTGGGQGTPTAPPTEPPSSGGGMSSGAKIGVGVGVAAGGLVLLAAVLFLFFQRRRRRQQQRGSELDGEGKLHRESSSGGATATATATAPATPGTPATTVVSELDSRAARPWSMRSELADTHLNPATPTTAGHSPGLAPVDEEGKDTKYIQAPEQWGSRWRRDGGAYGQQGPIAELPG